MEKTFHTNPIGKIKRRRSLNVPLFPLHAEAATVMVRRRAQSISTVASGSSSRKTLAVSNNQLKKLVDYGEEGDQSELDGDSGVDIMSLNFDALTATGDDDCNIIEPVPNIDSSELHQLMAYYHICNSVHHIHGISAPLFPIGTGGKETKGKEAHCDTPGEGLLEKAGLLMIARDPSLVRHYTEREWQLLIRRRLSQFQ